MNDIKKKLITVSDGIMHVDSQRGENGWDLLATALEGLGFERAVDSCTYISAEGGYQTLGAERTTDEIMDMFDFQLPDGTPVNQTVRQILDENAPVCLFPEEEERDPSDDEPDPSDEEHE